ncbi:hypothetical protein [Fictibacillus sp. 26RED30]|uniref:hypothetical protein n=1 Tax=Fictibacillus sp. 26RED30 TaxID=2745877 RepID=UPI0018CC7FB2|nr:hypothetical protein [Fictibacillus sp. 26RED30]MBH0159896.1 hypothetical protein [Fictibacillus sp. 26RED30]
MATQLQPTPTLYGKDAQNVMNDIIKNKPSASQKKELISKYRKMFEGVQRKG